VLQALKVNWNIEMKNFLNWFKPRKAYSSTDTLKNEGEKDYIYHQKIKSGDNAGSYTVIPVVGVGMGDLACMAIKEEYDRLVSNGKTVIYFDTKPPEPSLK
jgi:hypothetical protein